MAAIFAIIGFAAGMAAVNRYLRRRESEGSFDAGPSSAARPGLRTFFDYGPEGWGFDGIDQRPLQH